jgi:hypothetical protein
MKLCRDSDAKFENLIFILKTIEKVYDREIRIGWEVSE